MAKDRMDVLPDPIIHHIMSFLPTEDIFQLSKTSKRFVKLCLSTPFLKFQSPDLSGCDMATSLKICNFMKHRGIKKIHGLCIRWGWPVASPTMPFCNWLLYAIKCWLIYAIKCGVQVIDLEIKLVFPELRNECSFPPQLYQCRTLSRLTMNIHNGLLYWKYSILPSIPFSNLQSLSLKSVAVAVTDEHNFGQWVSSWTKIKEIELDQCTVWQDINIKSSSLERFVIVNPMDLCNLSIEGDRVREVRLEWSFDFKGDKSLRISAPNLESFCWFGNLNCDIVDFQDSNCLELVELCLVPKRNSSSVSSELFRAIRSTKELRIDGFIATILLEQYMASPSPPPPLFDVQSLCINVTEGKEDFDPLAISSLLTKFNNLKVLRLKSNSGFKKLKKLPASFQGGGCGFDTRCWECEDKLKEKVLKLEKVEIEILSSGGNELELVKYLLKYANQMEEIVVSYSSSISSRARNRLNEFKKASSSSNSKVVFKRI